MKHPAGWSITKLIFGVIFISAVVMWTYYETTSNLFVWDSIQYLYLNENHISSINIKTLFWMLTSLNEHNWHPLTWLSWAVDYQIYEGLNPWGFHFSNNILHTINSLLVFVLMLVIFELNCPHTKPKFIGTDNNSFLAAGLTALLFATHPQHVESVAWVAERKDLLCQLFMLISMLAYVKYVTCHKGVKRRWYLTTFGTFLLAVLSKPMAVTFPIVLLIIDIYPLRRTSLVQPIKVSIQKQAFLRLVVEKIPFLLVSGFLVLITIYAQKVDFTAVPLNWRLLNASNSIILYLEKLVVPVHFSAHYPYSVTAVEGITLRNFIPVAGILGIFSITLLAWLKGRPAWLIAWVFYLITLSPVLGLIQVGGQGAADRYAYFPTLPVYFLMGTGILMALSFSTNRKRLVLLLLVCIIALLTWITKLQVKVWQNPLTLWSQAVQSYPLNAYARNNLAISLLNHGHYELAAYHFEISEDLRPNDISMLDARSRTYLYLRRYEDALKDHVNLAMASETNPNVKADRNCIQYNIGWIYAHLDQFEGAVEMLGRVDTDSGSGKSARAWLDWLEENNKSMHKIKAYDELPGFCEILIPSKVRVNGSWQLTED